MGLSDVGLGYRLHGLPRLLEFWIDLRSSAYSNLLYLSFLVSARTLLVLLLIIFGCNIWSLGDLFEIFMDFRFGYSILFLLILLRDGDFVCDHFDEISVCLGNRVLLCLRERLLVQIIL